KGGERQDGRDLLLELRGNGFDIVRTRAELEAVPAWRRPKLFGAFNNADLAFANQVEERGQQPSLSDMVRRAIQLLQYNVGGYLLVVDAGLMRKAAQENNGERTLMQTVELDRAVAVARRYAGQKSTIIICGDVAVGGMTLNGFPFRHDNRIALLGLNSAGQPWITWATGPHGTRSYGAANIPGKQPNEQPEAPVEPAALYTKKALWILNSWRDLILYVGTPLFLVPMFLLAQARWSAQDIYVFVAAFGAMGHHLPGMIRAYGDRALFRRFRWRFIFAPIFLLSV